MKPPYRTDAPWTPRMDLGIIAVTVVVGTLLFAGNVDLRPSGDMAMYVNYAILPKFDDLTLHIAYYWLLYGLNHTLVPWTGAPLHEVAVYANVLFGAISLAIGYTLALRLLGSRRDAIVTLIITTLSGRVIANASSGEVYMMQTAFVLGSMLLFVHARAFWAGVAAGVAMLVSPLSAFAYLFFPAWILANGRPIRWGQMGWLVVGGSLVYLPYLVVYLQELLYGRRGLLVVSASTPIQLSMLATNFINYQIKHYSVLLFLALPALYELYRERRIALLAASVAIPHLYIIVKLTHEDNTFLLNVDFFIACVLAMGVRGLLRFRFGAWMAAPLFAGHAALLILSGVLFSGRHYDNYGEELRDIARTHLVGKNAVLLTDWNLSMTTTLFGRDSAQSLVEEDPLFSQMYDLTSPGGTGVPSLQGQELLLLETWEPGFYTRLLRSPSEIDVLRRDNAMKERAEARLGVRCGEIGRATLTLFRCERTPVEASAATSSEPAAP